MQVFKNYFKVLRNYKFSVIIYLVIFATMTLFFGISAKGDSEKTFEDINLVMVFVNNDVESELVDGLYEYLDSKYTFIHLDNDLDTLKDAIFFNQITHVLIVPEGFAESFINGEDVAIEEMTAENSNYADFGDIVINNYLSTARTYFELYPEYETEKILAMVNDSLESDVTVSLSEEVADTGTYTFMSIYHNFFVYILLAIFTTIICTVMSSYQKLDMKRRNISSPISLKTMQIQLFFANIVFALIATIVLMAVGYLVNGNYTINLNYIMFWANALVFALCATSIAFLISQFSVPREASIAVSNIISLGLAFISGALVPQFLLSEGVLTLAKFTPSYWFVAANNIIAESEISKGVFTKLLGYMGIELLFMLTIFAISLAIAKANSKAINN